MQVAEYLRRVLAPWAGFSWFREESSKEERQARGMQPWESSQVFIPSRLLFSDRQGVNSHFQKAPRMKGFVYVFILIHLLTHFPSMVFNIFTKLYN